MGIDVKIFFEYKNLCIYTFFLEDMHNPLSIIVIKKLKEFVESNF